MKTFRDLISEVAQPKSKDEIDFKAKHEIEMIDHPESEEHQHTSEKKGRRRLADYEKGQDMAVYEAKHDGDVEENAFMGKAAAAKKAGKDKFKLGDKKFPVTMKKDTAKAIVEARMNPKQKAAIDQYMKSIEGKNVPKDLVKASVDALMNALKESTNLTNKDWERDSRAVRASKDPKFVNKMITKWGERGNAWLNHPALKESIELTESNADKMISTLISAISKYSDKREFERAGATFELWAERFPSAYKKLLATPGIAGSFFSDLVEVLDIRVDLDESFEDLDEISKKTLQRYKDRATSDFVGRSISDPKLSKRIRGATTADEKIHGGARVRATESTEELDEISKKTLGSYVRKASDDMAGNAYQLGARDPLKPSASWSKAFKRRKGIAKATDKLTKESTDLTENFKQGSLTLKDGSKVIVSKQNADLLNQMFNDLNATNRREMMNVAMKDKDGFNEILGFAREAL